MKALSALLIASIAVAPSLIAEQPVVAQEQVRDSLSGFRFTTKRRVVVMPVQDKSGGQAGGLTDFAGEVLNQTLRNGGVKTVAWFKVQRKLKEMMSGGAAASPMGMGAASPYGGGSPYGQGNPQAAYMQQMQMMQMQQMQMMNAGMASRFGGGGGNSGAQGLVNDSNIIELIEAAKVLGARYIIRPVVLKASGTQNSTTSITPMGAIFGGSGKRKVETNSEIDIKIDIISTREEDIIASRTFTGRTVQVGKERANRLNGITGMQFFGGGSNTDQMKAAFYNTMDKIVDFLEYKMS